MPRLRASSNPNDEFVKFKSSVVSSKCPELETGINSVKPWIVPRTIAVIISANILTTIEGFEPKGKAVTISSCFTLIQSLIF